MTLTLSSFERCVLENVPQQMPQHQEEQALELQQELYLVKHTVELIESGPIACRRFGGERTLSLWSSNQFTQFELTHDQLKRDHFAR